MSVTTSIPYAQQFSAVINDVLSKPFEVDPTTIPFILRSGVPTPLRDINYELFSNFVQYKPGEAPDAAGWSITRFPKQWDDGTTTIAGVVEKDGKMYNVRYLKKGL